MSAIAWNPINEHRGPFQLVLIRPKKPTKARSADVTLEASTTSTIDSDDTESEACALLEDPRDTIISVQVWTTKDPKHIMTYKRHDKEKT